MSLLHVFVVLKRKETKNHIIYPSRPDVVCPFVVRCHLVRCSMSCVQ